MLETFQAYACGPAKVGSIEDNRLGGWYRYRASTVALHPGTVNSSLSQPFRGGEIGRSPTDAAQDMLNVIERLTPAETGRFYAYNGEQLPW